MVRVGVGVMVGVRDIVRVKVRVSVSIKVRVKHSVIGRSRFILSQQGHCAEL